MRSLAFAVVLGVLPISNGYVQSQLTHRSATRCVSLRGAAHAARLCVPSPATNGAVVPSTDAPDGGDAYVPLTMEELREDRGAAALGLVLGYVALGVVVYSQCVHARLLKLWHA